MSSSNFLYLAKSKNLNTLLESNLGGLPSDSLWKLDGAIGQEVRLSEAEAGALTDTTATGYSATTKLLAGTYQLVRVTTTAQTITAARGLACYWKLQSNGAWDLMEVTADDPGQGGAFAGIFLGPATVGKLVVIQTEGEAYLLGKASALTAASAVGDPLFIVAATGAFDVLAAGGLTIAQLASYAAISIDASVAGSLKRAFITNSKKRHLS